MKKIIFLTFIFTFSWLDHVYAADCNPIDEFEKVINAKVDGTDEPVIPVLSTTDNTTAQIPTGNAGTTGTDAGALSLSTTSVVPPVTGKVTTGQAARESKKGANQARHDDLAEIRQKQLETQARKEELSVAHQDDLLRGITPEIRQRLRDAGFDNNAFVGGVHDSDLGKLKKYSDLLSENSPESDLLLNILRGEGPPATRGAMRKLLDELGFEGKNLLNKDLSNDQLRALFGDGRNGGGALKGFLHELPGISEASKLLEAGQITEAQFLARMRANLFHNGPQEGFWNELTTIFLPGGMKNSTDPNMKKFFEGTVFEGKNVDGFIMPQYPTPTSFEGMVHTFYDRMSQGSRGGVDKIYNEIAGMADNRVAQMYEMVIESPEKTLKQLAELKKVAQTSKNITADQRKILEEMITTGENRLRRLRENNGVVFEFDDFKKIGFNPSPRPQRMTVYTQNEKGERVVETYTQMVDKRYKPSKITQVGDNAPVRTNFEQADMSQTGSGLADNLSLSVNREMVREEAIYGDAVTDLKLNSSYERQSRGQSRRTDAEDAGEHLEKRTDVEVPRRAYDPDQREILEDIEYQLGDRKEILLKKYNYGSEHNLSRADEIYLAGLADMLEREAALSGKSARQIEREVKAKLEEAMNYCRQRQ